MLNNIHQILMSAYQTTTVSKNVGTRWDRITANAGQALNWTLEMDARV